MNTKLCCLWYKDNIRVSRLIELCQVFLVIHILNHISWVAVVTPTYCPKSVRNRCVIEVFGGVCVLSLSFLEFSVGVRGFVIGMSQISSFFLECDNMNCTQWHLLIFAVSILTILSIFLIIYRNPQVTITFQELWLHQSDWPHNNYHTAINSSRNLRPYILDCICQETTQLWDDLNSHSSL